MRSFLRHHRGWFIFGFSLLAILVPGIVILARGVSATAGTLWTILPVLLTALLMILSRDVFVALFAGVLSSVLLFAAYSPAAAVDVLFTAMERSIGTKDHLCLLLLLILFATLMALAVRTEGAAAFARWVRRHVKSERTVLLLTAGISALFFFDDSYGCVTAGGLMRPVTEHYRISRAKMAFILDATAAPLCVLIPITSWSAAIGANTGRDLFYAAIPFSYYPLLILATVLIVILTGMDFGPMRRAEEQARQGVPTLTVSDDAETVSTDVALSKKRGSPVDFLFPVVAMVLCCLLCFLYTGGVGKPKYTVKEGDAVTLAEEASFSSASGGALCVTLPAGTRLTAGADLSFRADPAQQETGAPALLFDVPVRLTSAEGETLFAGTMPRFSPETPAEASVVGFGDALGAASPYAALALGAAIALCLTILFYTVRGVLSFRECMQTLPKGLRSVSPLLLLLSLSWLFAFLIGPERLGFGGYFSGVVEKAPLSVFFPVLFFLLAALLALASGTAFGTFSAFLPVAAGLSVSPALQVLAVSAVLSGAVLGDHASPLSDTTMMASAGTDCPVLEHVTTQLPYAGLCGISAAVGYLVGGVSESGLSGLAAALGTFALLLLAFFLKRLYGKKHA